MERVTNARRAVTELLIQKAMGTSRKKSEKMCACSSGSDWPLRLGIFLIEGSALTPRS